MTGIDPEALPNPLPEGSFDPWNFRTDVEVEVRGAKLKGHKVEAIDGKVGTVVGASLTPDNSYLVFTTGRWLFGTTMQLPAGTVNHVDRTEQKIYVDRGKDQIKAAPRVPAEAYDDPARRQAVADYYDETYRASSNR